MRDRWSSALRRLNANETRNSSNPPRVQPSPHTPGPFAVLKTNPLRSPIRAHFELVGIFNAKDAAVVRQSLVLGLALSVAPFLAGCPAENKSKELTSSDTKSTAPVEAHAHEHGPHDGEVVELGDNHGEVVLEKDRKVTVYILDGKLEKAVPLPEASAFLALKVGSESSKIDLKAMPQDGETDGKTSRFQSEAPLPESIKDGHDIAGRLTVTSAGKPVSGDVGHAH